MAIQSQIVNNSFTEIYVGGGNSITQSAPTNFHKFYTRRILTPTENISDYKEVTASERAAIEAADAKWEAPDTEFVKQCESEGVVYNRITGFFELNGLKDISTSEMRLIWLNRQQAPWNVMSSHRGQLRTNLFIASPITSSNNQIKVDCLFDSYSSATVINVSNSNDSIHATKIAGVYAFNNCGVLEEILGVFSLFTEVSTTTHPFTRCYNLHKLQLFDLKWSVSFKDSPNLSLDSLDFMVARASNSKPITITVHPDVYAKIQDETNTEWHALLAAGAAKQITFATTE